MASEVRSMNTLQQSWSRLLVLALVYLFYPYTLTAAADDTSSLSREQIKQFLLTAKIVNSHQSKKGITNTQRLTLSDGTLTHDASFQSVDEHQAVKKFADGGGEIHFVDSYKYNLAAYAIAEMIGLDDIMPVYVERKCQGHSGSLSWWLSVKMDEVERLKQKIAPPDNDAWNNQMYKIRVFDELVYDTDANLTNVLISSDWKIWRIDFTRAFRTYHHLKDPKDLVRCDRQLFERLKTLSANELTDKTKPYLTNEEIKALMARRDIIVEFFQKLMTEKGEKEVLY
jgi:hypothetical protein